MPELQGETLIEFGHRVIGAVLFVLSILLFMKVKKEKGRHQENSFGKMDDWKNNYIKKHLSFLTILLFITMALGAYMNLS